MKALIVYDSNTGNTERIAKELHEALKNLDFEVSLKRAGEAKEEEVAEADALLIGSPTQNRAPMYSVRSFLKRLEGMKLSGKFGAAFGSYGWSGEAPWLLRNAMKALGMNVMEETLRIKRTPKDEDLEGCRNFAKKFAEFVKG